MIPNQILSLHGHGLVEYLGIDEYFGETTLKFKRLEDREILYLWPEELTQLKDDSN